ncbi:hypothetical protein [Inediibacterium massiliense]|uniref:hypothetical protein n=1 Tax=Inediibacterium massiliense TaxID=1658111 RepID=UPI0006B5B7D9|nr:hypothetical protein [Inediibacterium massiliense]
MNKKNIFSKIKINENRLRKAYFLENITPIEQNKEQMQEEKMNLPKDFYKILGKMLIFVEKIDQ